MDDEDQLFLAWSNGDTDAGDQLLRLHFNSVYRFFVTKAPDAVDDLIQATFLETLSNKDKFRGDSTFRAFLLGIARHQLLRLYRRRSRDRLVFSPNEHCVLDTGTTPSAALGRKREEKLLLQAMQRIPVDLQIVLELHYWDGMSTRELAAVLEVPQGTIKSRLRRAREAVEGEIDALTEDPALRLSTRSCLEEWRKT